MQQINARAMLGNIKRVLAAGGSRKLSPAPRLTGKPEMNGRYRLFQDGGHAWLEVPRYAVVASGAAISSYSYYDEATGLAYLEEDCDLPAFLTAIGCGTEVIGKTVWSARPRELAPYGDRAVTA